MPPTHLALLLGVALVHVTAHVVIKRARRRWAFLWWMTLAGSVVYLPFLWQAPPVPPLGWGIILASAAFELGYYGSVVGAYRSGDLSLAYPLARGSAPLFLSLWGTLLLGEAASPAGLAGIGLIVAGLYVVNLPGLGEWAAPFRALRTAAPRWALFGGLCISAYTALDKVGVQLVTPVIYIYLVLAVCLALATPPVLALGGWPALRDEWRSGKWAILFAGVATLAGYATVLWVMRHGTPAVYAGAVREVSVVLAALAGSLGLKEGRAGPRLVGAALVAAGTALIAVAG
jgi:drug/metabolite transporter (DMT)-like permease